MMNKESGTITIYFDSTAPKVFSYSAIDVLYYGQIYEFVDRGTNRKMRAPVECSFVIVEEEKAREFKDGN